MFPFLCTIGNLNKVIRCVIRFNRNRHSMRKMCQIWIKVTQILQQTDKKLALLISENFIPTSLILYSSIIIKFIIHYKILIRYNLAHIHEFDIYKIFLMQDSSCRTHFDIIWANVYIFIYDRRIKGCNLLHPILEYNPQFHGKCHKTVRKT